MSKYLTPVELWKSIGEDAFTVVRGEVATSDGSAVYSLAHKNVVSGNEAIYSAGTLITSGFTVDYDNGLVNFSAEPGVAITSDYLYTDVPNSAVLATLDRADEELEKLTGQNFDLTTTSELIDVEQLQKIFFLQNVPVASLTSLSANTAGTVVDTPGWMLRTEGLGNDYLLKDTVSGEVQFIDNFPLEGPQRLKATYVYGYSSGSIPDIVKELDRLIASRSLVQNNNFRSVIKGRDDFESFNIEQINSRIQEITKLLRVNKYERI